VPSQLKLIFLKLAFNVQDVLLLIFCFVLCLVGILFVVVYFSVLWTLVVLSLLCCTYVLKSSLQ